MSDFLTFIIITGITFVALFILEPILRGILRLFGFYDVVQEGTAHVYVLFGKVELVVTEPGLQLLWLKMGIKALIVRWLGDRHVLDTRLDQRYQRSLPVNSEEGAPMGIGVWYEMKINDPVAYLFKNTDPRGSLAANVSNATVRELSNMPLQDMLETRHIMSRAVRAVVSPKSEQWGYKLGSVYIRKVHFRDANMIHQIEEKVVNRLRQVTSAILQDGANRVSLITSAAERKAAVEFAKASAMRPQIVGEALQKISTNPEVSDAMFKILETEGLLKSDARLTLLPKDNELMKQLVGAESIEDSSSRSSA